MSYSLTSDVAGPVSDGENLLYIYINGVRMRETMFSAFSGLYEQYATGGREWILYARAGDTIWLGTLQMEGYLERIIFCIDLMRQTQRSGVIVKPLKGQGEDELV